MMIIHLLGSRPKPAGSIPTPDEAYALIKSMVSYAGTYAVSGNEVTHHIEVSWNETWTGLRQTRTLTFDGNRVTLTTPPQPDPLDGKMSVRRLNWKKVD
jgi:lipocalin-like protein